MNKVSEIVQLNDGRWTKSTKLVNSMTGGEQSQKDCAARRCEVDKVCTNFTPTLPDGVPSQTTPTQPLSDGVLHPTAPAQPLSDGVLHPTTPAQHPQMEF